MTLMTEVGTCPTCHGAYRHVRRMIPWGDDVGVPCDNEWHDVEQLELDIAPLVKPDYIEGATIQERFEEFDRRNQWVMRAFEKLTADWLASGHQKIGMKMLTEILRWQYGRATVGDSEFKLNNSYVSRYSRRIVELHPEWENVFEQRSLKAA
jgi:hypothetical protein